MWDATKALFSKMRDPSAGARSLWGWNAGASSFPQRFFSKMRDPSEGGDGSPIGHRMQRCRLYRGMSKVPQGSL